MIALAKDFFLSGKGFAALQQVAVWRFPIMLPGDVDVPLPSHALYVCKTCVYCSVQDKGGYVDASDSNQKRWIKQLQSLRPDVLVDTIYSSQRANIHIEWALPVCKTSALWGPQQ